MSYVVAITGGSGTFARVMTRYLLNAYRDIRIRLISRSELPQVEMAEAFDHDPRLTFILADVCDTHRMSMAFRGVYIVLHAAALKHLPLGETNPAEMTRVNVDGSKSVLRAALDAEVGRAVLISTDKAVAPSSLYGATKMTAERLFIDGNVYSGESGTHFMATRYGNVMTSRGSVLQKYGALLGSGASRLPLTGFDMSRFWLEPDEAVDLVWRVATEGIRGHIYVPDLPAFWMTDLIRTLMGLDEGETVRDVVDLIDRRRGEKTSEALLTAQEMPYTRTLPGGGYAIEPAGPSYYGTDRFPYREYDSTSWHRRLSVPEMGKRIGALFPVGFHRG